MSTRVQGKAEIRKVGRTLGVVSVAKELRRQERTSDFKGYTENFTLSNLQDFLRLVGGSRWELSVVPISCIKCWHSSASLEKICGSADSVTGRILLGKQVRQLAGSVRQGRTLPGIFLVRSQNCQTAHWILDGHRRLLAHRAAKTPAVLVYHPSGLFGGSRVRIRRTLFAQTD